MIPIVLSLFLGSEWEFLANVFAEDAQNMQSTQRLTISQNAKTSYKILISADASPVIQNAAAELQDVFAKITDATLSIVKDDDANYADSSFFQTKGPFFFVGTSEAAEKAFPDLKNETFKEDEILIQSDAFGNILLTGDAKRGALYAVVTFLENTLGCRWWTSTESDIPHTPTLEITAPDERYAPPLTYRESYYHDAFDGKFAVHSRCNGVSEQIPNEWGGHNQFVFFVHSFYRLIPPTKYFHDHPDWFPEIDGMRKVGIPGWIQPGNVYDEFAKSIKPEQIYEGGTQLCLANDEMRAELTKNALEELRKNPDAKFISISQNDWHGFCTCEKCRKMDEENGSHSGSLITFVNKVAEDIEKEFPNVYVETLAYQYTRKPPKVVKPRQNVVVRLCTIECSFLQPLETGELNQSLAEDIRGWSAISPHLFVWNYLTNFSNYLLPHPNMRVLAPNLRFFVKNHTIGLFEQGDSFTTVGDFVAPRNWVVSHLLWNPNLDEKALWDEFFQRYYGPAGPILQEYLNALHDRAESTDYNLRCFLQNTNGWLDAETMLKSTEIANRARKSVENDPKLALRVNRALVSFDYNWLERWKELNLYCKINQIPFPGPENPREAAEQFLTFLELQGTRFHREAYAAYDWNEFKENLVNRFPLHPAKNPDLTALGQKNPDWNSALWVDIQDANFSIYRRAEGFGTNVDDAAASDGSAVQMPGSHYEWAASYAPKGVFTGKWHIYVAVRCDAAVAEGPAMTCGIYDEKNKKSVIHKTLDVPTICGPEYKLIDYGEVELTPDMYFWFAPPKRPDEVQNVYIDRLFLIR